MITEFSVDSRFSPVCFWCSDSLSLFGNVIR